MADQQTGSGQLSPTEQLTEQAQELLAQLTERATERVSESVQDLTDRLVDYAEHGGPGLVAAVTGGKSLAQGASPVGAALKAGWSGMKESVKQAFGGSGARKGGRGGRATKAMNIVETIDVGVPLRLAYDQWCQFQDFSQFMKKVSSVEKTSDEKSNWKAQVFWSHRTWEATVIEQVPDERIVWRSQGAKGQVDGAVTFHALTPNLTRILLVLEYYPQGLMERTGNLWRAQGRRARLELKHFRRQVMTRTVLDPESVEGWRGEIRDSEVVRTHEDAVAAEAEEGADVEDRQDAGDQDAADEDDRAAADEDHGEDGRDEDDSDDYGDDYDDRDEDDRDEDDRDEDDRDEDDRDEDDRDDGDDRDGDGRDDYGDYDYGDYDGYDADVDDADVDDEDDYDDELDRGPARSGRR